MGGDPPRGLFQASIAAAASIMVMNVVGSYVSALEAGMACPDWPLCPIPETLPVLVEFIHRAWAIVVLTTILLSAWRARLASGGTEIRVARSFAYLSLLVVAIQVAMGAILIFTSLRAELVVVHQLLAQLALALQVSAASLSWAASKKG